MLSGRGTMKTSTISPLEAQRKINYLRSQCPQMDADLYLRSCLETTLDYSDARLTAILKESKTGPGTMGQSLTYSTVHTQVATMCMHLNQLDAYKMHCKNQLEGTRSKGPSSWTTFLKKLLLLNLQKQKYPWKWRDLLTNAEIRECLQTTSLPRNLSWTDEKHAFLDFDMQAFELADEEASSVGSSTISSFFSSEHRSRSPLNWGDRPLTLLPSCGSN